jgi:hypothetical protein
MREAMKGSRVPGAISISVISAAAAARSRSSRVPFQPASFRTAATSALVFSPRKSTRASSGFLGSFFAKRVAGLPSLVALCCCASAETARTPQARVASSMTVSLAFMFLVLRYVATGRRRQRAAGAAPLVPPSRKDTWSRPFRPGH